MIKHNILKCVFGLESGCVRMWEESVKKVRLFGLWYVRVDVWEKFMGVCEWCNCCEVFLIFVKSVKYKFTNLSLYL